MSPLTARVLISDCINILSISVGKPKLGPTRDLNVYLQGPMPGIRPMKVGQYKAVGSCDCYGLVRCSDAELVPIARCTTLSECQAVALSDYLQWSGLELAPQEATQEV